MGAAALQTRMTDVSADLDAARDSTLAEIQKWIAETAKREHAEIMRTDPAPRSFRRWVDGSLGAREEIVRPDGVIFYMYERLELVAQYALEVLYNLSPVDSGAYRDAHQVFINGLPAPSLADFEPGQEIMISNLMPYARKIEMGDMAMTVPGSDMVYARAAKMVRRQYGMVARIQFTFRGAVSGLAPPRKKFNKTGGDRWGLRFPVLIISEL